MDERSLRKSGIELIGDVEWGTHFCQFYGGKQDLIDILVPYFAAGLANNEFCMWVCAEPLHEKEARAALRKAVPDLNERIKNGQIEIIPHTDWYLFDGQFDQDRVLKGWVDKLNGALERGFDGLRLTGNTFWLEKSEWQDFADYEAVVNDVIGNYRMVAICTYALEKCNAAEVADVVVNHQFALMKREGEWTVVESSDYKQARESLRLSERRYQLLFDSMDEAFALHEIVHDEHGKPCNYRFLQVNPAFEAQTGLKASEIVGRTVLEVLPGVEMEWIDTYCKVATTGVPVQFEDYAEALGKHYAVHAFSPAPGQFATIFSDITERKQAEEQSEERSEQLSEVNEELAASNEELEATNEELRVATDELHEEVKHRGQVEEELQRLNRTLRAHSRSDQTMMRANSEAEYLDEVCKIIVEECGHKMVWIGYAEDDENKSVRPVASSGFKKGYLETLNVTWADTELGRGPTGTAIRTGRSKSCRNMLTDPAFAPWRNEAVRRGYSSSIVLPLMNSDHAFGAISIYSTEPDPWTADEKNLLTDLADDVAYGVQVLRLRAENAQAEAALRDSERRYRTFVDVTSQFAWVTDPNGMVVEDIPALRRFTGQTYEQAKGAGWAEALHPDDLQHTMDVWNNAVSTKSFYEVEYRMRRHDGVYRLLLARGAPVLDQQGDVMEWVGTCVDITERKLAEDALRESEERFQAVFEGSSDCILVWDRQYKYLYANQAAIDHVGTTRDKVIGKNIRDGLGHVPDFMRLWMARIDKAFTTGEPFGVEDAIDVGGRLVYSESNISPIRDASGDTFAVSVVYRDITERKAAEGALRNSEQRLNRSQEIAHLGSWELDLINNKLYWSDEVYRIFGLVPQEFEATYEAFLEAVHQDDRAAVNDAYSGSLRDGRDAYEIEHRVVRKSDGQIRVVHERCEHVRDESGRIARSVGMVHDVTERKLADEKLALTRAEAERRAAELESFVHSMADGVVLFDNEARILLANEALKKMLGVPKKTPADVWSQQYELRTLDGNPLPIEQWPSRRALRGEDVHDARFKVITPWREVTASISGSPVRDAQRRVIGGTLSYRDISLLVEFEQRREEVYEREHKIADILQKALIPDTKYNFPGCDIAVRYEPALDEAAVGGDFYDVFDLGQGRIGILIGDVAGKGLAAAIRVAAARHSIRSYAYDDPRPSTILTRANEALCRDEPEQTLMLTAFVAVVDTRVGVVTYANGGHEAPLVRRADGVIEALSIGGRAVGVMCGWDYKEDSRRLSPGDTVVMVTDGITEARSAPDDYFGMDGVERHMARMERKSADAIAAGVLKAAKDFSGGKLRDDAAIVVFGLKQNGNGGRRK